MLARYWRVVGQAEREEIEATDEIPGNHEAWDTDAVGHIYEPGEVVFLFRGDEEGTRQAMSLACQRLEEDGVIYVLRLDASIEVFRDQSAGPGFASVVVAPPVRLNGRGCVKAASTKEAIVAIFESALPCED